MDLLSRQSQPADGGYALLVASTGGHLAQLYRLRKRLRGVPQRAVWVTFDTSQSRSLLADETVVFVRHTHSRDWRSVLANLRNGWRLLTEIRPSAVVSTGSGIALSFLPLSRLARIPAYYVESAARSDGPSLTGRIISLLPGVRLFTQYPRWETARWRYAGSVFDEYEPAAESHPPRDGLRVLVTLGTIKFPFPRLVERVQAILPPDSDVIWQTGSTELDDLPGEVHQVLPNSDMRRALSEADVVVAHSGVGSALDALEAGHHPVLIPREASRAEHIDDHQWQIAGELDRRGLATARNADELQPHDLETAARRSVFKREKPDQIPLGDP